MKEFEKLWIQPAGGGHSSEVHQFRFGNEEVAASIECLNMPVSLAKRRGTIKASVINGFANPPPHQTRQLNHHLKACRGQVEADLVALKPELLVLCPPCTDEGGWFHLNRVAKSRSFVTRDGAANWFECK